MYSNTPRAPCHDSRTHSGALIRTSAGLLALACLGCGGGDAGPLETTLHLEIIASDAPLSFLGAELQLQVTATDQDGVSVPTAGVRWSSADPEIASVSPTGLVTAVDNGAASIRAELEGASATREVVVAQMLDAVGIEGPDTVFDPGLRTRLVAVATDPGGAPFTRTPLAWRSSDETVVSVDGDGRARALAAGTARLSAGLDGVEGSHDLTVVPTLPLEIDTAVAEGFQWALEDISRQHGVIGTQATVLLPQAGAWTGVYGRSGETSVMRPEMLVPLGSVAKTVISGLLLALVDEGVVSLDDTLGRWLPAFDNVPPQVTLTEVLQNTSGIASYSSAPGFTDSLVADLGRVWKRDELVRTFVGPPLFPPGTSWKSSNTGYLLAEMVAEAATGRPLIDLYHAYLYEPLGLDGIAVLGAEEPSHPLAVTWNGPAGGPFVNFTETYDGPAFHTGNGFLGATVMSSATLARWGRALFGDFLSEPTRAAMLTAVPDDGTIPGQTGGGVGVRRFGFLGGTQWGHSGTTYNGSAFVLWDPGSGVVVGVVFNQPGPSHQQANFALVEELLRQALAATAVPSRR